MRFIHRSTSTQPSKKKRTILSVVALALVAIAISALLLSGSLVKKQPLVTINSNTSNQVNSAKDFSNYVGVNIHLSRNDGPYTDFAKVKQALEDLGIKQVRDALVDSNSQRDKFKQLASLGIKISATIPINSNSNAAIDATIEHSSSLNQALSSISGINEYDKTGGNWAETLRQLQEHLYQKVKSSPDLSKVPVLAPPLQFNTDPRILGDITNSADFGNLHVYLRGKTPEQVIAARLPDASINVKNKPVIVTETGFPNNDKFREAYNLPFSEKAAAIYLPRVLLENYRLGINKTYIYQLLDEDTATSQTQLSNYGKVYGLLRSDFTPKPTYLALKNLMTLLSDASSANNNKTLNFSLKSDKDVHKLVFSKSDGSYYLAVWQTASVYNRGANKDIALSPSQTSLSLDIAVNKIEQIDINQSLNPIQIFNNTKNIDFKLGSGVTVLKITL